MKRITRLVVSVLAFALLSVGGISQARAEAKYDADSLLAFIENNPSISDEDRDAWMKQAKKVFGSSAYSAYNKEAMNAAKAFIDQAIFYEYPVKKIMKSANQVFFDVTRWVPEPMARGYQLLVLAGRDPKVPIWQMVDDFPKYYQEEMALDMLNWWEDNLKNSKLPASERQRIQRSIAGTKPLIKPMLLDRLRLADKLEVSCHVGCEQEELTILEKLDKEIATVFQGVGNDARIYDGQATYCERMQYLAAEMGQTVECVPVPEVEKSAEAKAEESKAAVESVATADGQTDKPARRHHKRRRQLRQVETVGATFEMPVDSLVDPTKLTPENKAKLDKAIKTWLGTPYLFGGKTKKGIDCSSLMHELYLEAFNIELPPPARVQADYGKSVRLSKLKEGDLILFDTMDKGYISHVAIYVGTNEKGKQQIVHAGSKGVGYANLDGSYFQKALRGARRLVDEQPTKKAQKEAAKAEKAAAKAEKAAAKATDKAADSKQQTAR